MKVLDLFSGIGGFSLGLERAGMETVAFCEIEPFCQKVLRKHWPEVPIYEDIRTLEYEGTVDLICGGFPCQPFSVAGKRQGAKDDRNLWPAMFGIIQKHRPRWVIGENVAGFIDMALDDVAADLECAGYAVRAFDISSDAAGLPTMERHVWIVAQANSKRPQRGFDKAFPWKPALSWKFPRNDPREYRRWKLPAARVCGVGEGVPHRVDRNRALGNAVPPQIPEIFGAAIMEIERCTP